MYASQKWVKELIGKVLKKAKEDKLLGNCTTDDSIKEIKFGVDADGNYGYYKDGADTVTPFKSGDDTVSIDIYEYMKFNYNPITLSFKVSRYYKLEVAFDYENYDNNEVIFGNTSNNYTPHMTMYNGRYYYGYAGEQSFGSATSGKHVCIFNDENQKLVFDGIVVGSFPDVPNNEGSSNYTIGGNRPSGTNYTGKIYYYKVTDKRTGELIHNIVPIKLTINYKNIQRSLTYMYDLITGETYSAGFTLGGNVIGKG